MFSLKAKDKIGIVSPSGFINSFEDIKPAIDYLKCLGFEPVLGRHVFDKYFYMGGTDKDRAQDLHDFFSDPEIKAIFCTAGGCGAQRVLPFLDYKLIKNNPKPIFGLSDNTSLQLGIIAQTNIPCVTGFLLKYDSKSGQINPFVAESLKTVLSGHPQKITSGHPLQNGTAEGILIGGCLSTMRNLFGTAYMPSLKDKILLIEDVGEKTHKIAVMLTQLSQQPDFDKIRGIVFGQFVNCEPFEAQDGTTEDAINEFVDNLPKKIPVIKNFDYGHIAQRYVLPIGCPIRLNADDCSLEYLS